MRSTSSGAEHGDSGATLIEFLGASLLIVVALLVLAQMAVWVWARSVVMSATHEGARTASESGRRLDEGTARTRTLLHDGLGGGAAGFDVQAEQSGDSVAVRARGRAPMLVPFLPAFTITAQANAHDEDATGP